MKRVMVFVIVSGMSAVSAQEQQTPVDRYAVVTRNNVEPEKADQNSTLQVGNGDFAFNTDVTGLQTFYGMTLST